MRSAVPDSGPAATSIPKRASIRMRIPNRRVTQPPVSVRSALTTARRFASSCCLTRRHAVRHHLNRPCWSSYRVPTKLRPIWRSGNGNPWNSSAVPDAGRGGCGVKFGRSPVGSETALTVAPSSNDVLTASADLPAALRNVVDIVLALPNPAFLQWGPQNALLYNDAFRAGVDALTVDDVASLVSRALAGQEPGWRSTLLRQDDGAGCGTLCVCNESEARYQTLFDAIDEGFCIIEFLDGPAGPLSDYVHVAANSAYAINTGIPNVVGQKVREMVPDEAEGWVKLYAEVLKTGQPIRFERELVATGRHLELAAFRVEPASRREVAVLFKDVTPRKRAERALQELNETLEARVAAALAERKILADVVEGTTALVQVVDLDYRWIAVNGAATREFKRIFGVTPELGTRVFDVLHDQPEHRDVLSRIWSRALQGEEFSEVVAFSGPDGERRSYEMHMSMLYDAGGNRIGAYQFSYDVTDRLAEQERLRKTEEALRQAQKMEAVGQLTGGLAHDFNNLLAGISGAFQMIGVRLAQGRTRDVDKYVTAGQGAARRAASLTHRLLAFSRRQTLSPKPIVVNRLMTEFVELVRRSVGPSIQVETIEAVGLWPTMVDANQLENALLNLCINARDAMPN